MALRAKVTYTFQNDRPESAELRVSRFRKCFCVAVVLLAALPSEATINSKLLQSLHGNKFGIDRKGNLWAWDPVTSQVSRLTVAGAMTTSAALPKFSSVDADESWGIVGIAETTVTVVDWSGAVRKRVSIGDQAGDVCWIDKDHIAVSPRDADHRIAIWDTAKGTKVRTIGPMPVIDRSTPGASLAHATLLRYDPPRKRIVAVDAALGDVHFFDEHGYELRRVDVPPSDRSEVEAWLRKMDASNKMNRKSSVPAMWSYPTVGLSEDGTVWLVRDRDHPSGSVKIAKIGTNYAITERTLQVPECTALRIQVWQNTILMYRETDGPRTVCVGVRRSE